ncbi:MAG: sulfurtransferase TusA [Gammaproteobacteria bacterium]|nr:sulfurtransferase TusA [Gammaproteobacteria bacterium]MYF01928.1 sulfurtransferase TusA [Gammaproteobacteria bacterium]MYI78299.1 sulfurtransferase TusA [Gammaproteobacteria bacterium]
MSPPEYEHFIDTRGLVCPEPLMIVRNKVRTMQNGERLLVLATDPSTDRDFRNFCRFMKHTLELVEVANKEHKYVIRKGVQDAS